MCRFFVFFFFFCQSGNVVVVHHACISITLEMAHQQTWQIWRERISTVGHWIGAQDLLDLILSIGWCILLWGFLNNICYFSSLPFIYLITFLFTCFFIVIFYFCLYLLLWKFLWRVSIEMGFHRGPIERMAQSFWHPNVSLHNRNVDREIWYLAQSRRCARKLIDRIDSSTATKSVVKSYWWPIQVANTLRHLHLQLLKISPPSPPSVSGARNHTLDSLNKPSIFKPWSVIIISYTTIRLVNHTTNDTRRKTWAVLIIQQKQLLNFFSRLFLNEIFLVYWRKCPTLS